MNERLDESETLLSKYTYFRLSSTSSPETLTFVSRLASIQFSRERNKILPRRIFLATPSRCICNGRFLRAELLGESLGSIAQGQSAFVNARHALTPSGRICIQQRKRDLRCAALLVARFTVTLPLGSFSLNVNERYRDSYMIFPSEW